MASLDELPAHKEYLSNQLNRAHRQRKKEGIQIYKLTIDQTQLERAITLSDECHTPDEILHMMIDQSFARLNITVNEGLRLKELGATQDIISQYLQNEKKRLMPLSAEEFLQLIGKRDGINE